MAAFNLDNPVFSGLAYYSAICLLKMVVVQFLTVRARMKGRAVVNPEDARDPKNVRTDENVERVRRAHLNDLENIPMFILLGLFYVTTNPNLQTALWHFRIFTGARILHTICYLNGIQPFRGLGFLGGLAATISMGVQILMATK